MHLDLDGLSILMLLSFDEFPRASLVDISYLKFMQRLLILQVMQHKFTYFTKNMPYRCDTVYNSTYISAELSSAFHNFLIPHFSPFSGL